MRLKLLAVSLILLLSSCINQKHDQLNFNSEIFPYKIIDSEKKNLIYFSSTACKECRDFETELNSKKPLHHLLDSSITFHTLYLDDRDSVSIDNQLVRNGNMIRQKAKINRFALMEFCPFDSTPYFFLIEKNGLSKAFSITDYNNLTQFENEVRSDYKVLFNNQPNVKLIVNDSNETNYRIKQGYRKWLNYSDNDIQKAYEILLKALKNGDLPYKKTAHPFKMHQTEYFQILPLKNEKKQSVILINSLHKADYKYKSEYFQKIENWVDVDDGGFVYWSIEINLETNEYYNVRSNGV